MVLTLDGFDETEMNALRAIWTEEPAMSDINNSEDLLDVRDIIAHVEELEDLKENNSLANDEGEELDTLTKLLADLEGTGGDEQWRGDWYPVTMIRDSYFTDYARELLEDIGDLPKGLPGYIEIDWEATARNIRMDYTSVEFEGVTYWVRWV